MVLTEWDDELPRFARVEQIIREASEVLLIVKPWTTHHLDDHYQDAASEDIERTLELRAPDDKLFDYKPVHAVKS